MQTGIELALGANLLGSIISGLVAIYLLNLWNRQEQRLYTDLPLIFSITFISMAFNAMMQYLTIGGLLPDTMDVFRLRAVVISGSALPLLAALLNIWLPRIEKYHTRLMILSMAYWLLVSIIGTSQALIMSFLIPLLLIFSLGMLITFGITWKTGRLKEVRSDLMMLSLAIGFISQALKLPLQSLGLDWFVVSIAAMTAVIAAVALANPWYHRSLAVAISTKEDLSLFMN